MVTQSDRPVMSRRARAASSTSRRVLAALLAWSALLWSLPLSRVSAQPVATPITYQGRLDQNGQPVSQVRNLRFALFSTDQSDIPLANVLVTDVEIVDGLFAVPVAFPPGAFEGDAAFLEITLLPRFPGDDAVLLPRQRLGSTPRAESVRGLAIDPTGNVGIGGPAGTDSLTLHGTLALSGPGGSVRFADGTVQTTAAVAPAPGPRVVYAPGTAPVVDLSGEPVALAEPIRVSYNVSETQINFPQQIFATIPGALTVSPVVVRRPFTGNTAWRDLYLATIAGSSPPASANLRLLRVSSLTPGGANDCTFSMPNLMAVGHRIITVGSTAFEELRLHQTTLTAPVPVWPNGAVGNGARFEGTAPLGVRVAGAAIPGVDVLVYERSTEAVAVTGGPGVPTTFVQGRLLRPNYVFRTAFGSAPAMGSWLASVSTSSFRRAFSVTGPGGFSIAAFSDTAWVHTYRIIPGPNGEISEEWSVTNNFTR